MRQSFSCPHCHTHYQIPREYDGSSLLCSKCAKSFEIDFKGGDQGAARDGDDALFIAVDEATLLTGKLAIKLKYLSREQLKAAIQQQQKLKIAGAASLFEDLLVHEGLLTKVQRDYIVSIQELNKIRKSDDLFAGIITLNEFASNEQIDKSFKSQKKRFNKNKTGDSIAEILLETGTITQQQHDCSIQALKKIQQHIKENGLSIPISELISREGAIHPEDLTEINTGEDEALIEVSLPPPFTIKVSGDKLRAQLIIKSASRAPSLQAIKDELTSQSISTNIKNDNEIRRFLHGNPTTDEIFELATGVAPGKSKDATIKCNFDVDPLKIGKIKAGDIIDFRDRGEIPQVNEEDVIALKVPGSQGKEGIDIFGHKIEARKPDDIKLRVGKGAKLSSDKSGATANFDGKPVRTPAGIIDVMPLLKITGDIGIETGHVLFDGDIQVTGVVESGFKVTAGSLTVNELDGATVDIRGDLNVKGGIIDSKVHVGGDLKAKYVRNSTINAVGDVAITTEIRESEMEIGGELIADKCHLFGSKMGAGGDITLQDVGSGVSEASTITLASGAAYNAEKIVLSTAKAKQQGHIDRLQNNINEYNEQNESINKAIGTAAQVQDRAMVRDREQADMPAINAENKVAEKELNTLFSQQDKIAQDVQRLKEEQQRHKVEIEDIDNAIEALDSLITQERKVTQQLHVKGTIYEKTTIKALHTLLTTDASIHTVSIFEAQYTNEDGDESWRMNVEQLRLR